MLKIKETTEQTKVAKAILREDKKGVDIYYPTGAGVKDGNYFTNEVIIGGKSSSVVETGISIENDDNKIMFFIDNNTTLNKLGIYCETLTIKNNEEIILTLVNRTREAKKVSGGELLGTVFLFNVSDVEAIFEKYSAEKNEEVVEEQVVAHEVTEEQVVEDDIVEEQVVAHEVTEEQVVEDDIVIEEVEEEIPVVDSAITREPINDTPLPTEEQKHDVFMDED